MSLLLKWLESLHTTVSVNHRCLRKQSPFSNCQKCKDVCNRQAITMKDGRVVVDDSLCSSCGECMMICPVGSIECIPPKRDFINGMLVYSDKYVPTTKELLIYAAKGLKGVRYHRSDKKGNWIDVIQETNKKLVALHKAPIHFYNEEKLAGTKMDRRDFLRSFAFQGKSFVREFTPVSWRINPEDWTLNKYYPQTAFFECNLKQDTCTMCGVCFKVCPREVFAFKEAEVVVDMQKCTGCLLCVDVCSKKAIEITKTIVENEPEIISVYEKKCKRCHLLFKSFYESDEICFICKETQNKKF